jgi:hypothetical protein
MNEIISLADQLRTKMAKPDTPEKQQKPAKKREDKPPEIPAVIEQLRAYDTTADKTLIHGRVSAQTAQLIHHLKTATGIEVSRLISFSLSQLFERCPEIKILIKDHLDKFEL